jgi:nitrogen fixation protein NifQ
MQVAEVYDRLIGADAPDALGYSDAQFSAHVAGCIAALSLEEAASTGQPFLSCVGLDGAEFTALAAQVFPGAAALDVFPAYAADEVIERNPEEDCLLDLLRRCATARTPFEMLLAAMVARRAQRPNHLWQDLGLGNRRELSRLMNQHFRPLAVRNTADMKWKKFLYRTICRDEGFSLCTAPSCSECNDFEACFGEESGESFLARARRKAEAVR